MSDIVHGGNLFYYARVRARRWCGAFDSRSETARRTGIGRGRLADIERGRVPPHRDEVSVLAREYRAPELLDWCCENCIIGKERKERVGHGCQEGIHGDERSAREFFAG